MPPGGRIRRGPERAGRDLPGSLYPSSVPISRRPRKVPACQDRHGEADKCRGPERHDRSCGAIPYESGYPMTQQPADHEHQEADADPCRPSRHSLGRDPAHSGAKERKIGGKVPIAPRIPRTRESTNQTLRFTSRFRSSAAATIQLTAQAMAASVVFPASGPTP